MFLLGSVDLNEGSVTERVNELTDIENAFVRVARKKLFADSRIEHFIHMDLGMELDVDHLKKMSTDYAVAKELAIKDVQNIKHLTGNQSLIGDLVEKTAEEWNNRKDIFYQQTGYGQRPSEELCEHGEDENFGQQQGNENI